MARVGIDLDVVFAATLTAEQTFELPEQSNTTPAVVAAGFEYVARDLRREAEPWAWHDPGRRLPPIVSPASVLAHWANGAA